MRRRAEILRSDSPAEYCASAESGRQPNRSDDGAFPPYTFAVRNRFMERAIQLSVDNVVQGRGGPFGAVIVRAHEIIAEGANSVTMRNDPTAHAEVTAIREACSKLGTFELRGCELYSSCEPCPMCLGAIYWAHLDRVYFAGNALDASQAGFSDAFIYREISRPPSARSIPMVQMMHSEALEAFRVWEKQPNKITY